ncbi:Phenylalanine-tRNA ligase, class IIc, beta subunit [Syntrophomonas zehnderi OL-4]|uniref:Phenylalanine--tRNA ligase beta subunit n=1 Tax=Syntrophomonas zehnderi OL-4 TaxID=690567 RepID=A0A0E4C8K3_9FIRM|nr:phenylalanine--tRNA ligase subunit beta [Syntrophomonas zehnderi]CFX54049.1 Phenylalanine-tRNA ligase, class IIc, beta subunit [Syntrophomonas zehnderi OL-4]
MAVSINWMKDYVDFALDPHELAHELTMAGIAIEGVDEKDGDYLLELDLTPNRGDCLGMINLAREIAALNDSQIKIPEHNPQENGESIHNYIKVEIADADLCPRYTARLIKNVKIMPSPEWMQIRLINSGIRPINNIVDITNYVMLESNQPLHAFDYDLFSPAKKILIRRAGPDETIVTLDDVERKLDEEMLLITDNDRPVALAGIMGGQNTEINENTVNVLLESACFKRTGIRKTSRKLALRSDSSVRFEKGTDINGVIYAVNRAAYLMQELGAGEVVAGICDQYPEPQIPRQIVLRPQRVNYLLGTDISVPEVKGYIEKLAFKISEEGQDLLVYIPTYRPDIEMEADLIEEVARLYGYDKIKATLPRGNTTQGGLTTYQKFRDYLEDLLARTFNEVINYSFINPRYFDMLLLPDDSKLREFIEIANPLSEEQSVMRTILLPGMLETVSRNLARKNENLAFFEMGSVFYPHGGQPQEVLKVSAVVAGKSKLNWQKNNVVMDFFYLKGILENILLQLGIENLSFEEGVNPSYHPGRTAIVKSQGIELGIIGEIHPLVRQNFDIKPRACAMELDVNTLYELSSHRVMLDSIARYPAVERDLAILIKNDVPAAAVLKILRDCGSELLQNIVIFDIYEGDQVADGFKSMAFRMTFQSKERTLTETEVNTITEQMLVKLQNQLQASLR